MTKLSEFVIISTLIICFSSHPSATSFREDKSKFKHPTVQRQPYVIDIYIMELQLHIQEFKWLQINLTTVTDEH